MCPIPFSFNVKLQSILSLLFFHFSISSPPFSLSHYLSHTHTLSQILAGFFLIRFIFTFLLLLLNCNSYIFSSFYRLFFSQTHQRLPLQHVRSLHRLRPQHARPDPTVVLHQQRRQRLRLLLLQPQVSPAVSSASGEKTAGVTNGNYSDTGTRNQRISPHFNRQCDTNESPIHHQSYEDPEQLPQQFNQSVNWAVTNSLESQNARFTSTKCIRANKRTAKYVVYTVQFVTVFIFMLLFYFIRFLFFYHIFAYRDVRVFKTKFCQCAGFSLKCPVVVVVTETYKQHQHLLAVTECNLQYVSEIMNSKERPSRTILT